MMGDASLTHCLLRRHRLPVVAGDATLLLTKTDVGMPAGKTMLVSAALVCGLAFAYGASAQQLKKLEGWGRFKFGMTLAQAQKVALSPLVWVEASRYHFFTDIDGQTYEANIYFNGRNNVLAGVLLVAYPNMQRGKGCTEVINKISSGLTQLYGPPQEQHGAGPSGDHYERFQFADGRTIQTVVDLASCRSQIGYYTASEPIPTSGY